ncbi:MAG: hypothetical protein R3E89_04295 [Thiolinea sp.]
MPPIPYAAEDYLRDYGYKGLEAPLSADDGRLHLMGTEENSGDVLSRMIHASRIALSIGFVATSIAMVIGVMIGGLMGYFSGHCTCSACGWWRHFRGDSPTLFLLLTFVAFFGRNMYMMMVIIVRDQLVGHAAISVPSSSNCASRIMCRRRLPVVCRYAPSLFRHMLPNGVAPLLVSASFGVAFGILARRHRASWVGCGRCTVLGQMLDQGGQVLHLQLVDGGVSRRGDFHDGVCLQSDR